MSVLFCESCGGTWEGAPVVKIVQCLHCRKPLVKDERDLIPYAAGLRALDTFTKADMIPMRLLVEVMSGSIKETTGVEPDPNDFPEDYTELSDALYGYDFARCPACGELMDYCQGHGEIGDPYGYAILQAHDNGDHSMCSENGCDEQEH
jgi:hypothetical protein